MGKLFGTNGVRGVFSEDFTLEFVHDLVLAISTYFKDGTILVGYDGRDSSSVISKVVCSTLNSAGLDCHLAGLIPTPCLEFATKKLGLMWNCSRPSLATISSISLHLLHLVIIRPSAFT